MVNSNNETLLDTYPNSSLHDMVFGLTNDFFIDMSSLIFGYMYGYMYDLVGPYQIPHNITYGSPTYNSAEKRAILTFLDTNVYYNTIAEHSVVIYDANAGETNLTEFVDQLYSEFNFKDLFTLMFRVMYEEVYTRAIEYGQNLYEETDLKTLTAYYLRWVKIFYGVQLYHW